MERASGYSAYNMLLQSVDDISSLAQVQSGANANTLTLNSSAITSTLYAGETGDLHEVVVNSSGTLSMRVTSLGLLAEMRIYDATYNQLNFDISSSSGSSTTISAAVSPGTYYFEVRRRNSSSIGDYTVQATMP